MSGENGKAKFTQIATGRDGLFAIDADGAIWRYYPANKAAGRFAAWYRLTEFRKDNTKDAKADRGESTTLREE